MNSFLVKSGMTLSDCRLVAFYVVYASSVVGRLSDMAFTEARDLDDS